MRLLILMVVGAAFLLSSVYIFPSGNPQPADFLFAATAVFVTLRAGILKQKISVSGFPIAWAALVLWVVVVCMGWAIYHASADFLWHALFWIFNLLVGVVVIYLLSEGPRVERWVSNAISLGLVVSGVGVVLDLGSSVRVTGFFNNPNQLAYYSICAMGALLVLYRCRVPVRFLPLAAFGSGALGVLGAASLAAMGGLVLLMLGYAVANVGSLRRGVGFSVVAAIAVAGVVVFDGFSGGGISGNLEARMDRMDAKTGDWFEERKYDRVMAFPEYWILGAGEAHRERFYPYHVGEIHSSLGNLLFAYGLPGLLLFLLLLWTIVRRAPLAVWMVLAAPLVYSLTHMGLRTTMFWVLLAVIWWVYGRAKRMRAPRRSATLAPGRERGRAPLTRFNTRSV